MVKAVSIKDVVNLTTQISERLRKEANGPELMEELRETDPKRWQVVADVDAILTKWKYEVVRKAMGVPR